jgi:hypothetical protein
VSGVLSTHIGSHVDNRETVNPVGDVRAGHAPRTHALVFVVGEELDTVIPYVFGFGRLHVTVHLAVDSDVDDEPLGYDHVIPVPVRSVPAVSTIVGIGQHPLLFRVVPVAAVYFVLPDGHSVIEHVPADDAAVAPANVFALFAAVGSKTEHVPAHVASKLNSFVPGSRFAGGHDEHPVPVGEYP